MSFEDNGWDAYRRESLVSEPLCSATTTAAAVMSLLFFGHLRRRQIHARR